MALLVGSDKARKVWLSSILTTIWLYIGAEKSRGLLDRPAVLESQRALLKTLPKEDGGMVVR